MSKDTAEIATVTTSDGATAVQTGKTKVYGFVVNAAAADVTVVLADDSTTKLTFVLDISLVGLSKEVFLPIPFAVTTNLTVTVTGTGGSADILYGS